VPDEISGVPSSCRPRSVSWPFAYSFSKVCRFVKKINTFLWVCQVFVLFFFVLWHLKPCRTRSTWQDIQALCRPCCSPKYLLMQPSALGQILELFEALPVIINKLLELREQNIVPRSPARQMCEPALGLEPVGDRIFSVLFPSCTSYSMSRQRDRESMIALRFQSIGTINKFRLKHADPHIPS
jgi:hypothetical protein